MAEKEVIRTDRAPGPFQGAPYNQAIRVGDLVFVAGQLGISLETGGLAGETVEEQTEQIMENLAAILEAARRQRRLSRFGCLKRRGQLVGRE